VTTTPSRFDINHVVPLKEVGCPAGGRGRARGGFGRRTIPVSRGTLSVRDFGDAESPCRLAAAWPPFKMRAPILAG
jgi:hypothetical protein